jgi:hypothetical protein
VVRAVLVGVEYGMPLGVDADDDEAPLVLTDLSEKALDRAAGGCDHGSNHGAVDHDDVFAVGYRPL